MNTLSCDLREITRRTGLPLLEVRLLAEHVTLIERVRWMSDPVQTLPIDTVNTLDHLLSRRIAGEPVAYLLGEAEFYGRRFTVSPDVLIPRPETEELVERVLAYATQTDRGQMNVLDVGTGSGVIAITLALEYPHWAVQAGDISPAALAVAQANADRLKAPVTFRASNWLAAFKPDEQFDLIVSNPPYIMKGDLHLQQGDLRFEPAIALTDHADGLTAYTELARAARTRLRPGGSLWVEHGWHQQADVMRIFTKAGLTAVSGFSDLSGNARMVCAFQPAG